MYHHVQTELSDSWKIVHNLGKIPNVKIVDSNKQLAMADVIFDDLDSVTVKFGAPETGDVYLD